MTQEQEIAKLLIERASSGEHVPFKLIQTIQECFRTRTSRRAVKRVVKSLQASQDRLFKQYCKSIPSGKADVNTLLVCGVLKKTLGFYVEEYQILTDMIDEYDEYLLTDVNNLIGSILFEERPANKQWDHREH